MKITERGRAEEALREIEEKFSAAFRASPIALVIATLDGKYVEMNQAFCELLGYSREELLGKTAVDIGIFNSETRQEWAKAVERAGGVMTNVEFNFRLRNGISRTTLFSVETFTFHGAPHRLTTILDITERKRFEQALQESEQRYHTLVDQIPAIVYIDDISKNPGITMFVNSYIKKALGFTPEEWLSGGYDLWREVIHPDDHAQVLSEYQRCIQSGQPFDREYRVIARDGRLVWLHEHSTVWTDEEGHPISMHGIAHDITERKQAEEALRKSERVLREAEVLGHTGSWEQDLITGEIFNTEENLRLFFGDDRSKGDGFEDYAQVVHPDDREYVMQRRVELLEEDGPSDIEYRVVWPDGSVHVIFGRATVVRNELGPPIRVYGTNVDITERKRTEEELRLSEQRLQLLTETIPILVWSARADGVSDYYNAAFLQYLGRTLEEMQGWVWVETLHPDDRERSSALWTQAFSTGSAYEIEYRIRRASDGQYRWHLGRAVPLRDSSGNIVRWYGTCTDIHDQKRAEEEMNRHAAQAETLARIAARLNKQLDLDAVIHAVCEEAINTFKVSQATMSLYDKKRDLLVYAGGVNIPPGYAAMMEPITRSQFDDFLRAMGPVMVVTDIPSLPDVPNAEFSSHRNVRTVVTAAVLRDKELVGVLVIGVNDHVREFAKDELTLLKAISDQAAQAIQNSWLFESVSEHRQQLLVLSARLAEAQETERRAIARELHDEFGQSLTALKMDLAWLNDHMPPGSKSLREKLDSALDLTNETIQMTQKLASQLRPRMLDDLGLAAALEWHVNEWSKHTRIKAKINLPEEEWQLNPLLDTALYRVCQEALTNVARHAGTSKVEVSLAREGEEVVLTVRDYGRGIDGRKITSPESLGLLGMKERVEQIGGKLEVQSKMGKGTMVVARIPISQPSSYRKSHAAPKEPGQTKKSSKGKGSRRRKS